MTWFADFVLKLSTSLMFAFAIGVCVQSTLGEPLLTGAVSLIAYGLVWEQMGT